VRAPAKSLERRIEECLPKALRIIRPDEETWSSKYKHKWQHVEACERAVRAAIREIDSDPKTASASRIRKQVKRELAAIDATLAERRDSRARMRKAKWNLTNIDAHLANLCELRAKLGAYAQRRQKRTTKAAAQKMASVVLADELMNFNECPSIGATMKSPHARLAQLLYEAASGGKGIVKHQVEEYFKKVIAPWPEQVTDKAGRSRSKRRDKKIGEVEFVDLVEAKKETKVEEAYKARRREWERPKPDQSVQKK
jgi:hypothetical protein